MAWIMLFGLYLLKHAIMAHIVDAGYSQSRLPESKWWRSLTWYAICEVIVSALILHRYSGSVVSPVLILEFIGLFLAAVYERRAMVHQLLRRHAIAEFLIIVLYGALAYRVTRLP